MIARELRWSIAIAISAAQLACVSVSTRLEETVEVTGGDSLEERVRQAHRSLTAKFYDELRDHARRQFPGLSDADSKRLYLRINEQRGAGKVFIVVGLNGGVADGIDGERLLLTCRSFIERRLKDTNSPAEQPVR